MTAPRPRALVRRWARGSGPRLVTLAAVVLVGSAATAAVPLLTGRAVDLLAGGGTVEGALPFLAGVAGAGGVAAALLGLRTWLAHRIAEDVLAAARRDVHSAVGARNPLISERHPPGSLLSVLTVDVDALRIACRDAVPEIVASTALFVWVVVMMLVLSPVLTAVVLAGLPFVLVAAVHFRRVSGPAYADQRRELAATVGRLTEDLHGARTAVALGRDDDRRTGLMARHDRYLGTEFRAMRARNRFFPLLVGVEGLVVVAVICIGGAMTITDAIGLGIVVTFALALGQVFGPLRQLSTWVDLLQAAAAALDRIAAVVREPATIATPADRPVRPLPATGDLELDDVRFGYTPDRPALDGVTLRIRAGERVALTGATGAGKSTVARLLVRWADPGSGSVRFGGVDLRDTDPAEIGRTILFVPQEGLRLPGTVGDILRLLAPEASGSAAEQALREVAGSRVHPDDDARTLADGHAQLVVLAAVLLADPAAVILDEATAALDPDVSARVDAALDRVLTGRAVLVIAHRPETVARCDRAVLLDRGRLRPVPAAGSAEQ
ncbi:MULTISPECIES: ABC transporter ATP-binding protein [Pseudonocardia]|uniref:ABC transporter ATP-binding protein n=2 Tax=Pseudonocardia TaxID=1847 RepID=A0ABQ0RZB8_9PSEU|nr:MULTISPECIES: ABC transporter ATP-binding protein [Pseudonocardia]OSY37409.1 putative ABC transporter ATP-binding protein [Pseudonocardia autotrophica]TDN77266.1 ABC-type multidrug transport system fused ATPase/permease subunit [Pseudonocardia autotrophica]BBG01285.1 hypothetical protein Pdca_24940 [Pseudonocardia autotrophica]GEC26012.1 hypothetical protein PSA01_30410 [Pseudonocardia saturnea]